MLSPLLKILPLVFLAQALIIGSVFFISGRLLPHHLSPVYDAVGTVGRTVIASLFFFPLGNFVIGWTMGKFDPALVSPAIMAAVVVVQVAMTLLVTGQKPAPALWLATLVVMAGSVWVSLLLGQKPPV